MAISSEEWQVARRRLRAPGRRRAGRSCGGVSPRPRATVNAISIRVRTTRPGTAARYQSQPNPPNLTNNKHGAGAREPPRVHAAGQLKSQRLRPNCRVSGPLVGNALSVGSAHLERCALRSSTYSNHALHHNARLAIGWQRLDIIFPSIANHRRASRALKLHVDSR